MEVNEQNLRALTGYLEKTLSVENDERKEAEKFLMSIERNQGFPLLLATVMGQAGTATQLKIAAAITLKNLIKRNWAIHDDEVRIHDSDRHAIKSNIVTLMLVSTDAAVQRQISESISLIAREDFPSNWDDLLDTLVTNFATDNFVAINNCMRTAHSLFRRYRHENRSDALWLEIKYVLEKFAAPLTALFQKISKLIIESCQSDAIKIESIIDDCAYIRLWQCAVGVAKVFYDLNAQDLPEFFEDHMKDWMPNWFQLLQVESPRIRKLTDTSDDEPSVVEDLRSEICDIISMYAQKYDEEFAQYLPPFVGHVWQLLVSTGLHTKYDALISNAISFLANVAARPQYKQLFEEQETLSKICEGVIVPNMHIRETDQELFEDNPEEYMRKDIEGSDVDTRRRASSDLVQALCRHFEPQVIAIFSSYITQLLSNYQQNPDRNWAQKDVCIYLVMALVNKGQTSKFGATKTSELVNIPDFFNEHIYPELCATDVNAHPFLKADALKFLLTFRSQLPVACVHKSLQPVLLLLLANSVVVRSYAAHTLERLMIMKQTGTNNPVITEAQLVELCTLMLTNLFACISREGTDLSEHAMKCIMRTVQMLKAHIVPHTQLVVQKLSDKLAQVAKNPSKPHFNHYLFESYCVLIKQVHTAMGSNADIITEFENALFPPFTQILQQDVQEFMPYVFQILAMMLDLRPPRSGMPSSYGALFEFLLKAELWEQTGNVPALVRLLCSYLRIGAAEIVANQQLNPLLGVFQKLLASKQNDHFGFQLIDCVLEYVEWTHLSDNVRGLLMLMFHRLQKSKTTKFAKCFITFVCLLVVKRDAAYVTTTIDSIQPGIFTMVLEKIIIADAQKITGARDKKICQVAITQLLTEAATQCTAGDTRPELWSALLQCLIGLFELPEDATTDEDACLDLEEQPGYTAAYSQLAYALPIERLDPTGVSNTKAYVATRLEQLSRAQPDRFRNYTTNLDPKAAEFIKSYMDEARKLVDRNI